MSINRKASKQNAVDPHSDYWRERENVGVSQSHDTAWFSLGGLMLSEESRIEQTHTLECHLEDVLE